MKPGRVLVAFLAGCALVACDAVRYPGDGGEPPRPPETRDPDAPPPPPPTEPVTDPYGTGEEAGTPDPEPVSDPGPGDADAVIDGPGPAEPGPPEFEFSYFAPGALVPGSGTGAPQQIVHAPGITFPIRTAPAYLQSMVWGFGGGVGGGDECEPQFTLLSGQPDSPGPGYPRGHPERVPDPSRHA